MLVDDPLHRGKPYPRALEFVRAMQTLEESEELVGISLIESDAVIANKYHC